MPTIELQGTRFSCKVLPPKTLMERAWVQLEIGLENEYVSYQDVRRILPEDVEKWLTASARLLAGAYVRPYSIAFDGVGFAVDLYPSNDGESLTRTASRASRREKDCAMAVRILMRSGSSHSFLGGVYTLLFQKEQLKAFVEALRKEFYTLYASYAEGKGEYTFVGVSPLGYGGCHYWYYDPSGGLTAGDYVWVKMGRHATEQIVLVDCARRFTADNAPYDPARVKKVLRRATEEELSAASQAEQTALAGRAEE
jgi:hypothetical protein